MKRSIAMRFLRRGAHALVYHAYVKRAIAREDVTSMFGLSLRVSPTVFHPRFYLTSRFFGEYLQASDLRQKHVLDVGCGSGILSLVAARQGAMVTSVDINPRAVDCTLRNAGANRLGEKIRARQSDLFAQLSVKDTYDIIIWNPPLYPEEPIDNASRAWNAGKAFEVISRFAESARSHLRQHGRIIILVSSDTDTDSIISCFVSRHFMPVLVQSGRRLFETLSIYEFSA